MKLIIRVISGFLIVFISVVIYTMWDNQRVIVAKETIFIENLPNELAGFRILQVTDLHEKVFGEDQVKLINKVNQLDYDVIVFTGDMLDDENSDIYTPTYLLLEGIDNLTHALYVAGNTDPENSISVSERSANKHEFIRGMSERGVQSLESLYSINKGNATIHFVEFDISLKNPITQLEKLKGASSSSVKDIEYQKKLYNNMTILDDLTDDDVLISLNHYPLIDNRIDKYKNDQSILFRDYDLHIAGHYHGGQIRIPFYGALFVPEVYADSMFFPPRDRVKGVWEYNGLKQYVSAGLGSSNAVSWLDFRLFNTPEINLLTLKRSPS
ncbi:metallophosphoesterase [Salipaludibacillus daqingensis]|uniref:metallophosphoesterase n=1 Tax=Salipaludibacillus daqingensis TaxID=3041001 RepID=UPI002474415D|nr:metallophosphoesterase [Salipaludibacillus daqingensis]